MILSMDASIASNLVGTLQGFAWAVLHIRPALQSHGVLHIFVYILGYLNLLLVANLQSTLGNLPIGHSIWLQRILEVVCLVYCCQVFVAFSLQPFLQKSHQNMGLQVL